jgi:hypothetical protein
MPIQPDSPCSDIKRLGWRCGSVVASNMYETILSEVCQPPSITKDDWLIVISHSCDVTAPRIIQEPYAELLLCRKVSKADSNFINRKSTRRLHFRPNRAILPDLVLNAHATADRIIIPRQILNAGPPCDSRTMSEGAVRSIQKWYALRFDRAAWPDELNECLSSVKDKLELALATLDDEETELRVQYTELSPGKFRMVVYLVVSEEMWLEQPQFRANAISCFHQFLVELKKCTCIEVDDMSAAVNGADFSWQASRDTDIWNFANLTPLDREV